MEKINKSLPQSINILHDIITQLGDSLAVYGETICDILFTDNKPYHYQLVTSASRDSLLNKLNISLSGCRLNDLSFYYCDSKFHLIKDDFLKSDLEDKYYIDIHFTSDVIKYCNSLSLPLDNIVWDFNKLYNYELVKGCFDKGKLSGFDLTNNVICLIRAVRYIIKYNLDSSILMLLNKKKLNIDYLDKPLWKTEIIKLLELTKPSKAIELLREYNILSYLFAELLEGYNIHQNEYHKYDVYYHGLSSCDSSNVDEPIIRLAALFHDIGKPRVRKEVKGTQDNIQNTFYDHENIGARICHGILKRYGFSNNTVKRVSKLVSQHMFHYTGQWTDRAVRRFIKKVGNDLSFLLKLREADRLGNGKTKNRESRSIQNLERRINYILEEDSRFSVRDLDINGNDIMDAFDLSSGPIIGDILNFLLDKVLDGSYENEYNQLLEGAELWLKGRDIKVMAI